MQDAQSLAALGTVQLETASQLSRQMLDDIQKLNTLGQQFKDDLDALAADGIKRAQARPDIPWLPATGSHISHAPSTGSPCAGDG